MAFCHIDIEKPRGCHCTISARVRGYASSTSARCAWDDSVEYQRELADTKPTHPRE